jgi:O-acetylhomoserine (thiol)-lyase
VRFADVHDVEGLAKLIDCRTKALFCESIENPSGEVADLPALAHLAHSHGIPLIADNTVPSPYLCRPIEHGADIVVHSLTKYIGGHGRVIGGVLVDSGKFPWSEHKAKYRSLNQPDRTCQGIVFTEAFGPCAYIVKASAIPLRSIGAAIAPQAAFLALQGLGTLPVRMDRICDNAVALAEYLASHRRVTWVSYAALPNHPDRPLTEKYTGGRASGILSFGVKGGREASARFIGSLKLVMCAANIGDIRSQAVHPATSTHRQLSPGDQKKAGVSEDMICVSVGLEHIDDVVDDIDRALEESQSAA